MSSTSVFTSSESQKIWREHMKHNYINNQWISPCVLQVPDNLRESKPEAYTPQLLGLGPYHHFRAEVQHMERYKRAAVIDYQENVDRNKFIELVEKSADEFEPKIRSCYDKYLDLDKETLAWVVIVDGLFLLHFINTCLNFEELRKPEDNHLEESAAKKLAKHPKFGALVADAFMLENQIPIILILEMRSFLRQSFNVDADEELRDKFGRFCREQSPLQLTSDVISIDEAFDKNNHVLHFMYQMIVKNKSGVDISQDNNDDDGDPDGEDISQDNSNDGDDPDGEADNEEGEISQTNQTLGSRVSGLARELASQGGEILEHTIEEFNAALSDAKSAGLKVSGNIEKISNILRNVQKAFHLQNKKDSLGDEIGIPSASRLHVILKMTFKNCCGIEDTALDGEKKILHLPVITLRANSEVILRNLAAYEAASKMGSTQLRDYVDLMCGLIKSEKDVVLLKDAGIINHVELLKDAGIIKSEKELKKKKNDVEFLRKEAKIIREIVRMCSGFKKSDEKPDEKSKPHVTVIKVTYHFNKAGFVKFCRSITNLFAASVKFFRPFFGLAVVVLLALQSFCEFYECRSSWHGGGGAAALRDLYLGELDLDPKTRLILPRKMYRYY